MCSRGQVDVTQSHVDVIQGSDEGSRGQDDVTNSGDDEINSRDDATRSSCFAGRCLPALLRRSTPSCEDAQLLCFPLQIVERLEGGGLLIQSLLVLRLDELQRVDGA